MSAYTLLNHVKQTIYGRVFRNLDEVMTALGEFVERYYLRCRLAILRFLAPLQAREAYALRMAA